jgi:CRISPR/Cas system endoribonuclease Cas6 (RAMP superfamily)
MTQFNPLVNSLNQTAFVQRQQAATKAQQIQRAQQLAKNVAAEDDQLQFQVENSEELTPTRPEHDQDQRPRRESPSKNPASDDDDEQPSLDLTA